LNGTAKKTADKCRITREDLLSEETFSLILGESDRYLRTKMLNECRELASELNCRRVFDENFEAYKESLSDIERIGCVPGKSSFPPGRPTINTGSWTADKTGVYRTKRLPGGEKTEEYASSIPIMPTALLTNADTGREKLELSYYNGTWRSAVFDRSVTASSVKIVETADYGTEANSENARLLVRYISDCIKLNRENIPHRTSLSRMGWYEDSFIPYTDGIVFDGEHDFKTLYDSVKTSGSLDEWKEHIAKLRKNIYIRLLMGASFASPLLSKIGALPFILHLWGGTEAGKTVGLMAAMSVWGDPSMGKMVRTMNMTVNSAMTTAAVLHDLPFAGDELQIIKEHSGNYDRLIMSLCEGVDRGRMKYDSLSTAKTWNCAFLFTGEEPITRSSSGGGAKNRVIEVECRGKVAENGRETAETVRKNHGRAGREYIKYLSTLEEDLGKIYTHFISQLENIPCTDKQRLSMAAIMMGDAIGIAALFEDEHPLNAEDVAPFLKSRSEVDVSERAFDYISDIVAINDARFSSDSHGDIYGEVWGRIDTDISDSGEEIRLAYINKTKLTELLREGGYEFDAVKAKWAERGQLIKNTQGKLYHQTKCHGIKGTYILLNICR